MPDTALDPGDSQWQDNKELPLGLLLLFVVMVVAVVVVIVMGRGRCKSLNPIHRA